MAELERTKNALLKTKDGLLKTEDILLKTTDGPSVNKKLLTHILTNIPIYPSTTHPHTHRHPTWRITITSAYG